MSTDGGLFFLQKYYLAKAANVFSTESQTLK
jgi:hypothetical protein